MEEVIAFGQKDYVHTQKDPRKDMAALRQAGFDAVVDGGENIAQFSQAAESPDHLWLLLQPWSMLSWMGWVQLPQPRHLSHEHGGTASAQASHPDAMHSQGNELDQLFRVRACRE